MKEFKNIVADYNGSTTILLNNKKWILKGVITGEDILVDDSGDKPLIKKILKPSSKRISYGCIYQGGCGGCQYMHTSYEYELELKVNYLNELFKSFKIPKILMIPAEESLHYRNKSQMTYKLSKSKKVVCGFYQEKSHNIVTVDDCMLQAEQANKLIRDLNLILTKNKIEPYDERTKRGVLKHVFVRYGFGTQEIMLVLVTNGEIFPGRNNVLKSLLKTNNKITTIVQNYNPRDTSIVLGDKNKVLHGQGFIYEKVGDYRFKISPNSFFQINSLGMKTLYDTAIKQADLKKTDVVLDAYCGVGTISVFMAKYVKEVIGVELNSQAVKDAIINAKLNNINNASFICDDATNYITHMAKDRRKVDVLIMDPPRDGSTKQFINAISYLKPRTIIYISCEPTTLKRDLYDFAQIDYFPKSIVGVDMFARTDNIEVVATLYQENDK